MDETSPTAYNPKDRFKRHLKRKSSSRCLENAFQAIPASSSSNLFSNLETESCPAPVSRNPFKVGSPLRKRRPPPQVNFAESVFDFEENAQDPSDVPQRLKGSNENSSSIYTRESPRKSPRKRAPAKRTDFGRFQSFDPNTLKELCPVTDFSQLHGVFKKEEAVEEVKESEITPIDLRIGSKLRISCSSPFSWMNSKRETGIVAVRIPASDRYEGLKYFNEVFRGKLNSPINYPISPISLLESASLYWQFPVIPGMPLYPRILSQLGKIQRVPLPPLVSKTMMNQWVESLEQLFHSYKKGDRESFYVTCNAFNVLFTKMGNDDIDFMEDSQSCFRTASGQVMFAVVTHTTSQIREHLRNQGVEYSVVGAKNLKRMSSSFNMTENTFDSFTAENSMSQPGDVSKNASSGEKLADESGEKKKEEEGEDSSDENESPTKANQEWLKKVGVSPRTVFKSSAARKLSTVSKQDSISALIVKGSSLQSLYNTLMSSDMVHEKTGPYTKVPPTLLASSAFLYGQVLSLAKTSQIVKKGGKAEYVVELDQGPILPHCSKMLVDFLRSANMCDTEKPAIIKVAERHTSNGMNESTPGAQEWATLEVFPNAVKWKQT